MDFKQYNAVQVSVSEKNPTIPLTHLLHAVSCCRLVKLLYLVKRFAMLGLIYSLVATAHASDIDINKNWRSIAIKGYDTVAYFTMGKAVKGKSKHEFRWQDARWRFASEEHLNLFIANPDKYAPRFGGYCAEGMAIGRKASIDPQAWLIIDDELYLNYSTEVRDEMSRHPKSTIEKANSAWQKFVQRVRAK